MDRLGVIALVGAAVFLQAGVAFAGPLIFTEPQLGMLPLVAGAGGVLAAARYWLSK
jgi:hypothetical protein